MERVKLALGMSAAHSQHRLRGPCEAALRSTAMARSSRICARTGDTCPLAIADVLLMGRGHSYGQLARFTSRE